jgi:hypothetical protein
MAPGSQEATFVSEDEHEEGESSMARIADKVPLAGHTKSVTSTDVGSLLEKSQKYWVYPEPNHKKSQR